MKAAIIGGGVIGGGWASRFLLNGWDVSVYDPDPQSKRKISGVDILGLSSDIIHDDATAESPFRVFLKIMKIPQNS